AAIRKSVNARTVSMRTKITRRGLAGDSVWKEGLKLRPQAGCVISQVAVEVGSTVRLVAGSESYETMATSCG
ncbi:MAG TPA: hypothetical protein VGP44_09035, partial [Gemmatimonadales bacterium]|nr:hypothetical protein [Gemmatimonadales bacterium]